MTAYFLDFARLGGKPRIARDGFWWAGQYAYKTIDLQPYVFAKANGSLAMASGDSGCGIMKGDAIGRVVTAV